MEYDSSIKKNNIMTFVNKWIELENIMLSEISSLLLPGSSLFQNLQVWLHVGCCHFETTASTRKTPGQTNWALSQGSLSPTNDSVPPGPSH